MFSVLGLVALGAVAACMAATTHSYRREIRKMLYNLQGDVMDTKATVKEGFANVEVALAELQNCTCQIVDFGGEQS